MENAHGSGDEKKVKRPLKSYLPQPVLNSLRWLGELSAEAMGTFMVALVGLVAAYVAWHAERHVQAQAEQLKIQSEHLREQAALSTAALGSATVTEARTLWNELLIRFDNDSMEKARTNLIRYREDFEGAESELIRTTQQFLAHYVYHTDKTPPNTSLPTRFKADTDEQRETFFSDLNASRRRIKNFHQGIMVLSVACAIRDETRKKLFDLRFKNVPRFLETYWLPVDMAHSKARRQSGEDARACEMVGWYKTEGKSGPATVRNCSPLQVEQPRCG
jgi:hypothetical protein